MLSLNLIVYLKGVTLNLANKSVEPNLKWETKMGTDADSNYNINFVKSLKGKLKGGKLVIDGERVWNAENSDRKCYSCRAWNNGWLVKQMMGF